MKIITTMIEDEVFEASTSDQIKATLDMRSLPEKKAQSPVEMLLSSLSACGAVDVVSILKKRRKHLDAFTIETTGVRREHPPRGFTTIHCKFIVTSRDVTEDELYKTSKLSLEKYCSVASTLNADITFSVEVRRPQE